jgi:serine/threonine-protein kinase
VVQNIDGINYELKEYFDMSFISNYGKVFKVFDKQDSGCICFGVHSKDKRLFIKFAGAKTIRYKGTKDNAILVLKSACKVYMDLRHRNLVSFINGVDIKNGYLAIFEWTDAECMGKQYECRYKFFELSLIDRIHIFEDILEFHRFVSEQGYVAIDFYDGSIMFDFSSKRTIICDIDCYSKMPYINSMGRMWGSSRFMSPEEFKKGSLLDEVTNVFLMGATAFALLGDASDKTLQKWNAGKELFAVAEKAVSKDRENRYQSINEFIIAWTNARKAK